MYIKIERRSSQDLAFVELIECIGKSNNKRFALTGLEFGLVFRGDIEITKALGLNGEVNLQRLPFYIMNLQSIGWIK